MSTPSRPRPNSKLTDTETRLDSTRLHDGRSYGNMDDIDESELDAELECLGDELVRLWEEL